MTLYLDTSSLVKLYINEPGTDAVRKLVDEATIVVTSGLAYPETRASLARRRRERVLLPGAFALAKELHGLRRTRFRGRQRVQIQLWLTAAAMNIKKAVRELTRMAPSPSQPELLGPEPFYPLCTASPAARRFPSSSKNPFGNNPGR